jgi:hypothetical protein
MALAELGGRPHVEHRDGARQLHKRFRRDSLNHSFKLGNLSALIHIKNDKIPYRLEMMPLLSTQCEAKRGKTN